MTWLTGVLGAGEARRVVGGRRGAGAAGLLGVVGAGREETACRVLAGGAVAAGADGGSGSGFGDCCWWAVGNCAG